MAQISDSHLGALMERAQGGEKVAYGELLRLLLPIIERMIRNQRSNISDEQDVLQDILLSLHNVRQTYDPARPFMPWLSTIVHRRVVDSIRRRSRIANYETAGGDLLETISDSPTKYVVEEFADPETLKRAIAELPLPQRMALEMLKLREMSLKEASAASGMSIAALKIATHRALKTLRKRLIGRDAPLMGMEND